MLFVFNWTIFVSNMLLMMLFFNLVLKEKVSPLLVLSMFVLLAIFMNVIPIQVWEHLLIVSTRNLLGMDYFILKSLISHVVVFIMVCFMYHGKTGYKFIVVIEHVFALQFSDVMAVLIFNKLAADKSVSDLSIERIVLMIFYNLGYFFLTMTFANLFHRKDKFRIKAQLQGALILLFSVQVSLLFAIYRKSVLSGEEFYLSLMIFLGIILLLTILSFVIAVNTLMDIREIAEKESEAQKLTIQKEYNKRYYEMAIDNAKRAAKVRHDIANQLQAAYMLFISDREEERRKAKELFAQIRAKSGY